MMISFGSCVGFPSKAHSSSISNDIKTFKPTIFVGVPRIFEKLRKSVFTEVEKRGGLISLLFKYGLYVKGKKIKKNGDKRWLFDKFVFKTVADQLGGRVSMIISGSAPATGEMLMFMRCCFDGDLHEGYGCTETTGMCTVTIAGDNSGSNIGPPMINTMIKLVDVPEIGYYTTDRPNPRGEICVKGHCVFKGYYKRPHGTQRVMDKDGWYHTGDIGMFDKTGSVVIIDRKTHFFKLPQGEYVSPEKIESILTSDHLIQQAFVYGDSNRPCLVAILHPDRDRLIEYASRRLKNFNPRELTNSIMKGRNDGDAKSGRSEKTEESNSYHASDSNSSTSMSTTPTQNNASAYNELYKILCRRPVLIKLLLKDLKAQLKSCGLVELEVIRNIYLDPVPFQDSDLLSISMKLVRDKAKAHYSKVIDKLYQDINV
ncbi:Fatty acyl-CoA synthetase A [Zancudomyces culisetae]|uniref:Fatty acyl-CoA synthetase A n=1 Tax=Zancudomyces culisetae TaxID=1213189 RepID=A0A1R1PI91_ZANCU|nr:Fatty acyl-CoA synthetase A [Zancudomyces culisetae]OMH80886.1 Fatty acyl-CoA synthetase A [Zancudomyces culisetae]|eukprot:OMH80701.1 Fatty acyl-CoA synthetase A [Zancudomyces culisetae]